MADQSASQQQPRVRVADFTVEFGDPSCRTIAVNCLRMKLRGRFSLASLHNRPQGGRDVGSAMASMPDIPGQRLRVSVKDQRALLFDPLEKDKELLDRVNGALRRAMVIQSDAGYTFVPKSEIKLDDPDLLKTLLIELGEKLNTNKLRVVDGDLPDSETIARLPGKQIYDPMSSSRHKPKYVDDVAAWEKELDAQGV